MPPAVCLAGLLLAAGLVVSRPLVLEWRHGLPIAAGAPGDRAVLVRAPGDTLQLYYQLWLVRDAVLRGAPLLHDPYQFRVDGARWNLPQSFPPLALPFVLLSVLGPHAAYNLLVLLSFPLSGLAAYALVRSYTGHALAASVAGAAYALVPARLGPLFGGQPAGFAAALVPLMLWGLDAALTRGRLWGGALGGGACLALAMLEPHYTYVVGGLILAYVPIRWVTARPPRIAGRPLLAFAVLTGAGAGWLWLLRQTLLVGSIAEAGRSLAEVRLFSPGPAALLMPATYGGLVLPALALVGLLAPGAGPQRALRLFYGGVCVAGLLVSLGPTLPQFPLYPALHRWLPLFALIRNPEKFRLLVSLGVSVLAGYGVRGLTARIPPRLTRYAGAAIMGTVVAGTAPWHAIAVTRLPDSPIYPLLRAEAHRVLYLPVWPGDSAWSSTYLYDVTHTRAPMVNGYSPLVSRRYRTEVFEPLQGLNVGDLRPADHALLRRLGVTHVVLDRAVFPPQVSPFPSAFTRDRLRASPGLSLERAADPLWVYRVTDRPPAGPRPMTSPVGVFFEAEALARETGVLDDAELASGRRIVAARPGTARPGFMMFGPYRLLPSGVYRARFRVRGAGLRAEVTTDQGRQVLGWQSVEPTAAWADVSVPFVVGRARPVEYRVHWNGEGEAAVDWVSVVFADRPEPEWAFEVEELPHQLVGERRDPGASGGWAGYADPVESRRIPLVSGPARLYPAGRYAVTLRARSETAAPGPVLRLTVTEPAGRTLAARTVEAGELPPGGYREVGLDFELATSTVVEFPIWYLGGTGIFFDRVVVTPR